MYFRIFLLLLGFPLVAQAGDVDFSNYDVPLYTQIVDRIKAKIAPRLGEGALTRERYFIIPFAYQDRGKSPGILAFVHLCHSGVRGQQTSKADLWVANAKIQESGIRSVYHQLDTSRFPQQSSPVRL